MEVHKAVPRTDRFCGPLVIAPCVLLLSSVLAAGLRADNDTVTAQPTSSRFEPITRSLLESRRNDLKTAKDLDDAARAKAADYYKQADDALKAAEDQKGKGTDFKRLTEQAATTAEKLKAELRRLREASLARFSLPRPAPDADATLATLETRLIVARGPLDALSRKQAELDKEPNRRARRRKDIRALLLAGPDRAGDLKKQRSASPPSDEPAAVTLARRTAVQARLQALEEEMSTLQAELARYDAEDAVDLVRLQRDVASRRVAAAEREVKQLTEAIDRVRRAEAERAVEEARRMEVEAHPLLRTYAAENTRLAEERSKIKPMETAEHELKEATTTLEKLTDQFTKTRQKAEAVGLTGPIGQLLRKQRDHLPDVALYRRSVDSYSQAIDEVQFRLYELDEMRGTTTNLQPILRDILAQAGNLSAGRRQLLRRAAVGLFERRQECIDALIRNYSAYYDTLLELVITQRKLIKVLDQYADYIDERVLWIRSSRPLALRDMFRGRPIGWLVSPTNWGQVFECIWSDSRARPWSPLTFALLLGLFVFIRRRFRVDIETLGHEAHRSNFTKFLPTMRAFSLTLARSAAAAALPAFIGWRLSVSAYEVDFPSAVANALLLTACFYLPLDFVRRSCRKDALAETHFGLPAGVLLTIGSNLRWATTIGVPLFFVSQLLHAADAESLRNALERLLFAAGMLLGAFFFYRVLRPRSGVVRELLAIEEWSEHLQLACRWGGIGGAMLIAGLVMAGYDYTARQFVWRIYLSGVCLVSGYYLRALFLRWILIHRRLMGMQQIKERRVTELRSTVAADASVAAAVLTEPVPKIDLAALSAQTRTLVNVAILTSVFVGCWWIWSDMFPSMGILNRWELWTTTVGDRPETISVGHLLSAILIAAMTWIAVRNIPGLLEMTVLQRLPLDTAGRFAFSTLARYTIVVVGLVSASSAIGIGWSKVQWLATALTFGLAFGLQEIFANFIAGLIILFERPVRVGDMVTLDDVTGIVNRIRIRATTIINSDRKEFIVPNKEFITGRVLNWTLSDTINRIVINVSVSYGSDTELAQDLLLKAAHDHPAVLRDPAPSASFEEFGDSGLKLVLRCFLPNLTERTRVIHELHTAINKAFAARGIEIPPPKDPPKPMLPLVSRTPPPHLSRTG